MTNDKILTATVVDSWKLVIKRFDKILGIFTDEQLQQQVAPDKNRGWGIAGTAFGREEFAALVARKSATT